MSAHGTPRVNATGRTDGRLKAHRSGEGNFVMIYRELMESPAWQAMSLAARKVLERLMIEHMGHAGRENGNLVCTYTDFERFGVRRASVKLALAELVALGLIEISHVGHRSAAQFRNPNRYRLTFLGVAGHPMPTHEWKKVKDDNRARALIEAVRSTNAEARRRKTKSRARPRNE